MCNQIANERATDLATASGDDDFFHATVLYGQSDTKAIIERSRDHRTPPQRRSRPS